MRRWRYAVFACRRRWAIGRSLHPEQGETARGNAMPTGLGGSVGLFQASQQWSTMSWKDLKIRFENQFSRMNCHAFSCGFSSGHLAGKEISAMLRGTITRPRDASPPDRPEGLRVRPARSGWRFREMEVHRLCVAPWHHERRALAVLGTDRAEDIGRVNSSVPPLGQALDASERVILSFWLTRPSSANQLSRLHVRLR